MPEQPTADGSCIVIVATDAPLHAHTLRRLAKRAGLGLARTSSTAGDGSGEIILAFSTAQRIPYRALGGRVNITILSEGSYDNRGLNAIFDAVVAATEEAVINALLAATTMRGRDGHTLHALPMTACARCWLIHKLGVAFGALCVGFTRVAEKKGRMYAASQTARGHRDAC